jgi:hypothetical protein
MTLAECPVCGRLCCDHTVEDRGASLDEERPRIPTVARLLDTQDSKCWRYLYKLEEAVPVAEKGVKLICLVCFHDGFCGSHRETG